jgi:hypothetical protein
VSQTEHHVMAATFTSPHTQYDNVQEAQVAQAKFVALRREHSAYEAKMDAAVVHLQTQLANNQAEARAQIDTWQARAKAAEDSTGEILAHYPHRCIHYDALQSTAHQSW